MIDGTLSRLEPGYETNIGLLYRLLQELGPNWYQTVGYDSGIQGKGFRKWLNVAAGIGINKSICAGYSTLCSKYRSGDKIMLFGYSRGAYAVRSLAGFIDRIGLLTLEHATERHIQRAFRYYQSRSISLAARKFSNAYCHGDIKIEFIGVWDTVAALGLPYPILTRLAPMATEFHDSSLGETVKNAYQALAADEDRVGYDPLVWKCKPGWAGNVEQAWFPGAHADIGGHIGDRPEMRPLSNIPFRWMLQKAEGCGMVLPEGWVDQFPVAADAPWHGSHSGSARFFINRTARRIGTGDGEFFHASIAKRQSALPDYVPYAKSTKSAKVTIRTEPPEEVREHQPQG